jgi:glycerophosphoryl diester phosphodiesterase
VENPQRTLSFDKPFLVIAHRGDSTHAPENTLAAFQRAIDTGADMIELDVQLSADGVPLVFHDAVLNAHSNGEGLLSDYSADVLRKLDAGSWFSNEFAGEKIPLLTDVLELTKGKINLNIEIKPESVTESIEGGIEEIICREVALFEMEDQVIISSFDYRVLERTRKINSSIRTGLLYNRKESGRLTPSELVQKYGAFSFHCSRWQVRKQWIAQCKKMGTPVYVYTVNGRWTMKSLIKRGVAGIFSDKPGVLKDVSDEILQLN